nr:unnamed protein product [Callosobruchus analis]
MEAEINKKYCNVTTRVAIQIYLQAMSGKKKTRKKGSYLDLLGTLRLEKYVLHNVMDPSTTDQKE